MVPAAPGLAAERGAGPATTSVSAYRLRRPVDQGRGFAVVIARSADGQTFTPVQVITEDDMDAKSLERPVLAVPPRVAGGCISAVPRRAPSTGGWRCWRRPRRTPSTRGSGRSSCPATTARDQGPVIVRTGSEWHMWACVDPLTDPEQQHRPDAWAKYATSADGLDWGVDTEPPCSPGPAHWDSRGVRISDVQLGTDGVIAYYARPGQRRRELRGADRGWRPGQSPACWPRSGRPRPRSRRPPGTGCATSASCRCAMAARACTTNHPRRRSARAAHRARAEAVGTGGTEPFSTPAAGRCEPVAGPQAGPRPARLSHPAAPASR